MTRDALPQLLRDARRAGCFFCPASDAEAMARAAPSAGLWFGRIDLAGCTGKRDLLERMARAMAFPDWFGHNWDALADVLGDLSWLNPVGGHVLLIEHGATLREAAPRDHATVVDVLQSAADDWRGRGVPFWALIALPDADFHAPAAGDRPAHPGPPGRS